MKAETKNQETVFPVVVAGNRATLTGKSVSGIKFPSELVSHIETKKPKPNDWVYAQFWVAKPFFLKALLRGKKPGRYLMVKFHLSDNKTKSMYCRCAWLNEQALSFIKNYWEKEIPK